MKIVEVAAGLICHEGRYLIAKRKSGVHLAGYWEFPGGKRERGETLEECLQRELLEELSIRIRAPIPFQVIRHDYSDKIVELHFFHCTIETGRAVPRESAEIRWVLPRELRSFQFPPADRRIIDALQGEGVSS